MKSIASILLFAVAATAANVTVYDCNTVATAIHAKIAKKGEEGCEFDECCIWESFDTGIVDTIKPLRSSAPLNGAQQPRQPGSNCKPKVEKDGSVRGKVFDS